MASTARSLTVAVDVNPATRAVATGTETFTREVSSRLAAMAPEYRWRFFAARPSPQLGVDVMVLPFPRLWSQVRLPIALAAEHPDLLFVPGHAIPFAWAGKVLTVVHDLAFERYPDAYRPGERSYLRVSTRWAVTRCRLLIAVSESTKADLVELYGFPAERIRVVHLGIRPPSVQAAPAARLQDLGVDGTFVLQVGRVEPRKNQAAALAAVEKMDGVKLVVAGPERESALSQRLRSSSHCVVLGAVSQALLELLYKKAAAVVVPSLYEGFGLPVLEAMARGKVVVAAKASSLPEVGGEGALYYHPAATADELAGILEQVLNDQALRARLGRLARARAARFTWDKTASGVAAVVRELLS